MLIRPRRVDGVSEDAQDTEQREVGGFGERVRGHEAEDGWTVENASRWRSIGGAKPTADYGGRFPSFLASPLSKS